MSSLSGSIKSESVAESVDVECIEFSTPVSPSFSSPTFSRKRKVVYEDNVDDEILELIKSNTQILKESW